MENLLQEKRIVIGMYLVHLMSVTQDSKQFGPKKDKI